MSHDELSTYEHDSELGRWRYAGRPLAPDLRELAETIWEVEGTQAYARDKVLPNGRLELIVSLGPPQALLEPGGARRFETAFLSGLQAGPLVTECPGGVHLVGVTLRPLGAYRILGIAMHELAEGVHELEAVLARAARDLRARVLDARGTPARFSAVETFLRARAGRGRAASPEVAWLLRRIEACEGRVRLESLRERLGWSRRRLVAAVREEAGLAPKTIARIARFRGVVARLPEEGRVDWARVADEAGFADQSHLIRDFHEFAGLTPTGFLAARLPGGGVRAD
jgi:AraC-like DNA-binding protein